MPGKPTVLALTACYLPGYKGGGPIRSVANIVDRLSDRFVFRIFTDDRDHGDRETYQCVERDRWVRFGSAEVYYASRRSQTAASLVRLLRNTPHDIVYFNSLFNLRFTLLPLGIRRVGLVDSKPVVLAPRGELDSGALALKSAKKRTFLRAAQWVGLYSEIYWQASSEHEARRIVEVMDVPRSRVFVAPNLPTVPNTMCQREPTLAGAPMVVAFLSRISRMKNLDFALRAFREVNASVVFLIYGVPEDEEYWAECQRLIPTLPENVRVEYRGDLPHSQVHETLCAVDLFFLPTRGENYGHVIVEALAAGVPVLISDQTPWEDLADRGAGWTLPLDDTARFAAVIDEQANESLAHRATMSRQARAYADEIVAADEVVQANVTLFSSVLSSSSLARVEDS